MKKVAIFVHANESELAKALHALLYAQELKEAGHEVKVVFDGAGTVWIRKFEEPENKYYPLYKTVKQLDVIEGVCEYCAGAFGVAEDVEKSGFNSLGEKNGHPSISSFIDQGYQLIIL
ncbi:hypothetical protein NP92_08495 [Anoxybacillus gonensis]|uniref:DsrE/DsrF-like family protein n=2 Tax=Anoxybacillaceae TaxID=3120669 RepID=A0A0D8BYD3_GEOKU|nr:MULTISPECIES: DsrE family protein [Bacillaceae]AKS38376.1 hypothetical protein AFK25_07375 [Anoxybacillus gonensis]KGP60455.1 hypothetical protein NP92_08495 [Anoxybacillus gonensis]KJE29140.1 dsrE/DsrF-like family protein [Geobacillus kaustophilus]MCX8046312.1 DsrE family protein [Anoxybacillus gonensis]MDO0877746.1 DsrE family protein [Anoxybacillus gonensis]